MRIDLISGKYFRISYRAKIVSPSGVPTAPRGLTPPGTPIPGIAFALAGIWPCRDTELRNQRVRHIVGPQSSRTGRDVDRVDRGEALPRSSATNIRERRHAIQASFVVG